MAVRFETTRDDFPPNLENLRIQHVTLYFAREIFIPLALALTLNFILTPVLTAVQKLRIGRVPAVFLVMILFAAAPRVWAASFTASALASTVIAS